MDKALSFLKSSWVSGLAMAVLGAVITTLYQALSAGGQVDWKAVGLAGLLAGLAYLIHQLGLSPDETKVFGVKR